MIDQWSADGDMGHGFLVPFVVGWILWRERRHWMQLPLEPSLWGVPVVALGAGLQAVGAVGAGLFAGSLALLVSITGAVICLGGLQLLRSWTFPLLLTLFMLPKLAVFYNLVTLPLQLLASHLAAGMLTACGVGVLRAGNILDVNGHQIAVAEACSGIRYLLPLAFLSVVFAYWSGSKPWMRLAFLVWAIPVAILANAIRVGFSAYSPRLAEGNVHLLLGTAIFAGCLAALFLFQKLSTKLAGLVPHA